MSSAANRLSASHLWAGGSFKLSGEGKRHRQIQGGFNWKQVLKTHVLPRVAEFAKRGVDTLQKKIEEKIGDGMRKHMNLSGLGRRVKRRTVAPKPRVSYGVGKRRSPKNTTQKKARYVLF